jgi:surfeit locus 1 family protein
MQFKPRLIPTLATMCLLALFVYLGLWQSGKAQRRAAELAQHSARARLGPIAIEAKPIDPLQLQDAPVTVRGQYEPQHQFFVDNRQENGQPGVHVVTPLKIEGGETRILVNRGWVGWTQGRQTLPVVATPQGVVQVSGVAAVPVNKAFFLMPEHAEVQPQLWSRLDVPRFAREHAYPVQAVVVLQSGADASDGLVRHWQAPEDRVAMHQSYAYQWFGMAAALLGFYTVASLRRKIQT